MNETGRVTSPASGARADFGVDAPSVVLGFLAIGVMSSFFTIFAAGGNAPLLVGVFAVATLVGLGTAGGMFYTSKKGKRVLWQRTLDELALQGHEQVLDLGCGRGLVLIETAKRVPDGHVTGIDIWRSKDQSGNSPKVTDTNAQVEGVADRVDIRDGDMRQLPFADGAFDLVTASLAIHTIDERTGRAAAVRELGRVLKPGGRAVIIDIARTREYVEVLGSLGFVDLHLSGRQLSIYPPARTLIARKP